MGRRAELCGGETKGAVPREDKRAELHNRETIGKKSELYSYGR